MEQQQRRTEQAVGRQSTLPPDAPPKRPPLLVAVADEEQVVGKVDVVRRISVGDVLDPRPRGRPTIFPSAQPTVGHGGRAIMCQPVAKSSGSAAPAALHVVLFSGGRGSSVLSSQLVKDPRVRLTIAINGYDDGASTGEVRRFLGDSLGPSDFRKNASRLAAELGTAPARPARDARRPAAGGHRPRGGRSIACDAAREPAGRAAPIARHGSARRLPGRAGLDRAARSTSATAASATWCSPARSSWPGAGSTPPSTTTARSLGLPAGPHRERDRRHQRVPGRGRRRTARCSAARRRSSTRTGGTGSTTSS